MYKTLISALALVGTTSALAQNIYQLGLYEVTTQSLACNVSPQPCYETSCQLLIIPRGTTFEAVDVINQYDSWEDRPWFFTNYNCYVRASKEYIKRLPDVLPYSVYVFAPPSNVRISPNGPVQCVLNSHEWITVYGYSNGWYKTDACGVMGFIHESQVSGG